MIAESTDLSPWAAADMALSFIDSEDSGFRPAATPVGPCFAVSSAVFVSVAGMGMQMWVFRGVDRLDQAAAALLLTGFPVAGARSVARLRVIAALVGQLGEDLYEGRVPGGTVRCWSGNQHCGNDCASVSSQRWINGSRCATT